MPWFKPEPDALPPNHPYRELVRRQIGGAQQLLDQYPAHGLLVCEDGPGGDNALIAVARSRRLPVLVVPFGVGDSHDYDIFLDDKHREGNLNFVPTCPLGDFNRQVKLPGIFDANTGFGNALNVQRTVREFERAGAAMVQLEDQGFPKSFWYLEGKTLVPVTEMEGKLRAALNARRSADTLILARTDAVAVEGLAAALERAERYLACGVDALFIEALRSTDELDAACPRFAQRVPCWPTWWRAAPRRCATRASWAAAAFASSSPGRHGPRCGAHLAGVIRQLAPAPGHRALEGTDA